MYPVIRFAKEMWKFRARPLGLLETHVSHHRCWPWDLDPWMELNNGRTLTLYDLGRLPLGQRIGLNRALALNGWGMTVAGASVRYRRRIRAFHRVEMRSRLICWDARFLYFEHGFFRDGEALNHLLVRSAATDAKGILAPARLIAAMGHPGAESPPMPGWIAAWCAAEAERPWPPVI